MTDTRLYSSPGALVIAAFLFLTTGLLIAVRVGSEPAIVLAVCAGIPLSLLFMRKWPMALIAGLMFVGNFKSTPAQGISLSDPTLIVLALCAGAIGIELLYHISGATDFSLRRLFAGQTTVALLFCVFVTVLIASFAYTPAEQYGASKVTRFAVFEVLAFFAPFVLLTTRSRLQQLIHWTILLSVALAAKDFYLLLHPSAEVLKGDTDITQIGDGMLFGIALLTVIFANPIRSRLATYLLCSLLVGAMFIATARTPLVALFIALLVTAVVMRSGDAGVSRKRLFAGLAASMVVGGAVLLWMQTLPGATEKVHWKEEELLAFATGAQLSSGTMRERVELDRSALHATMEHPVGGLGVGGWSVYYSKQDIPRFPHNFILEVSAEEGLVGVSLLIALLLVLLRRAKALLATHTFSFLFPTFVFLVLYNMMTGDLENRQLWFWFGMIAAATRFLRDPKLRPTTI